MQLETLLLPQSHLRIAAVRITPDRLTLVAEPVTNCACCPSCGHRSTRIHSRYVRTVQDLPVHGRPVRLRLLLRRFFCGRTGCPHLTFAERLSPLTAAHARKTARLISSLSYIAFTAGGEAGARLAGELGMPGSADTLLRLLHRAAAPTVGDAPQVLGVDDFALRRGQVYGTILCDLEKHRPVDLLPERSSAAFAAWLKAHPGAAIISRDRGGDYAKGAREGAPHATQVADRWHLLHNLTNALREAVDARQALLAEVTDEVKVAMAPAPRAAPEPATPARLSRVDQKKRQSRDRRLARYLQVRELLGKGTKIRKIARTLNLGRHTVERFAACEQFPERATPTPRQRPIDAHVAYLKQRWEEGCNDAAELWREIRSKGFAGSSYMVQRLVRPWRAAGDRPVRGPKRVAAPRIIRPSARRIAWLALGHIREPAEQDELILQAIYRRWPELAETAELCRQFASLLREHDVESLGAWMQLVAEPGTLPEVKRFAEVLREDWAAVVEAVRQPWSQGQTEGQINRLKLIKRQMYGRASFALLRQRVLHVLNGTDAAHALPA